MISRLIDVAVVALWLLMFTVSGIIGISKTKFFNFSGTERVNEFKLTLCIIGSMWRLLMILKPILTLE